MCLDDFGRISIEVRGESFIIHPDKSAWVSKDSHPEFDMEDLDDMITALLDAKALER